MLLFYRRSKFKWTMFPLLVLHITTSAVLLLSLTTASSMQTSASHGAPVPNAETARKQLNHESTQTSATHSTTNKELDTTEATNEYIAPITTLDNYGDDQSWTESDVITDNSRVLVHTSSLETVFDSTNNTKDTITSDQILGDVLSINANVESNYTHTRVNESFKEIAFNSLPNNYKLRKIKSEVNTTGQKNVRNISEQGLLNMTTREHFLDIFSTTIQGNISTQENVDEISVQENLQSTTSKESLFGGTEQNSVHNSSTLINKVSYYFSNSSENISDWNVLIQNTTHSVTNDSYEETRNNTSKTQSGAEYIMEEPVSSNSTEQLNRKDSEKVNETSHAEQDLSTTTPPTTKEPPLHLTEEDSSWDEDQQSSDISEEAHNSEVEESGERGCVSCRMRDIDKQYRILQFKNQILNGLHMTHPPNTSGVSVPNVPPMMHLYEMDRDLNSDNPQDNNDEDDDFVSKTERVFVAAKEAPWAQWMNLSSFMHFTPAIQHYNSYIESAYIWFYIRPHPKPPKIVTVERVIPDNRSTRKFATQKLFTLKLPMVKASGWKRVNVTHILKQWIWHPLTNLGLVIKAEDAFENNLIVLPGAGDVDKGYEPWLDTKIMESRHISRKRRSEPLMCVENSTDTPCCRHPLIVGFAEFGWSWIIAPTHVHADYCTGECRMTMLDEYPISWVTDQQRTERSSCCTPTKLAHLPLLYFDEHQNVVYQILQNMKVERCGCA